ncbi:MAG: hypothetical protein H0T56_03105 [Pseudaminobacter sp.]|nr:hypothetical protein [Pseudaminobacter sp.]
MTERADRYMVFGLKRGLTAASAVAFLALAGCATATIEDAVPVAEQVPVPTPAPTASVETVAVAAEPAPVAAEPETVAVAPGPIDTGTFPNLNVAPQAAAAQISPGEKAANLAGLSAARAGQVAPGGATSSAAEKLRLRKLAATHAAEALKEIENN